MPRDAAAIDQEPFMPTMRAARFNAGNRRLTVEQVPVPEPGPGEVLVRVKACGICLSDVHLIDGSLPATLPEVTPGHESAGIVEAAGPGVAGWQPGQRVAMAGGKVCGRCRNCAHGRYEECLDLQLMGFAYDGAWAEYVRVPAPTLTEVPDHIPFEQAAIVADAVATPYAGLVERAGLRAGQSAGLWGIGGLGIHAVRIARMVGAAPIIAVDPSERARARALEAGADHAVDPGAGDVRAAILAHTGGTGLDLAVDLVGANAVLAEAAGCLGRFGKLLMVGLSTDPIQLGPGVVFGVSGHSLLGHLGYQKRHLDELITLVSSGRLDISGSVSGTLALDDIAEGVEQLASKRGDPIRLVVLP
jgi:threonine dehydrogenase-like Zn-dependent dehydrogenase